MTKKEIEELLFQAMFGHLKHAYSRANIEPKLRDFDTFFKEKLSWNFSHHKERHSISVFESSDLLLYLVYYDGNKEVTLYDRDHWLEIKDHFYD